METSAIREMKIPGSRWSRRVVRNEFVNREVKIGQW